MSQNVFNIGSASKTPYPNLPTSYEADKTTSKSHKTLVVDRERNPSTPPSKLDYDFLEYLKIKKSKHFLV
jgi:hypothetical protein